MCLGSVERGWGWAHLREGSATRCCCQLATLHRGAWRTGARAAAAAAGRPPAPWAGRHEMLCTMLVAHAIAG
jgi:hypothetical protein